MGRGFWKTWEQSRHSSTAAYVLGVRRSPSGARTRVRNLREPHQGQSSRRGSWKGSGPGASWPGSGRGVEGMAAPGGDGDARADIGLKKVRK
ncbi:hypothetical protein GCM10017771_15210 [Streptomyces capitiformicae]|uniref:Uncharacterized protein n=1 Tax=Streptomyces capitiformicae TaxID=2014920 RepID=A0A919L5P4_9ACTN|nr:hypothetical protein GCM10017771_15210 [Streptomyces capitiformicae]